MGLSLSQTRFGSWHFPNAEELVDLAVSERGARGHIVNHAVAAVRPCIALRISLLDDGRIVAAQHGAAAIGMRWKIHDGFSKRHIRFCRVSARTRLADCMTNFIAKHVLDTGQCAGANAAVAGYRYDCTCTIVPLQIASDMSIRCSVVCDNTDEPRAEFPARRTRDSARRFRRDALDAQACMYVTRFGAAIESRCPAQISSTIRPSQWPTHGL